MYSGHLLKKDTSKEKNECIFAFQSDSIVTSNKFHNTDHKKGHKASEMKLTPIADCTVGQNGLKCETCCIHTSVAK